MNLGILGFRGNPKNGNKRGVWVAPPELVKKTHDFMVSTFISEFGNIDNINVFDLEGINEVARDVSDTLGIQLFIKDYFGSKNEERVQAVINDSSHILLVKKGKTAGGDVVKSLLKNTDKPVFYFDVTTNDYGILDEDTFRDKKSFPEYLPTLEYLMSNDALCLDIETTHNDYSAVTIQVGIAGLNNSNIYYDKLVKTVENTCEKAYEKHGILDEDRVNAQNFSEVYQEIRPLLEKFPIIAFNAKFDYRVLMSDISKLGEPIPCLDFIDTMDMFKALFKVPNISLEKVCKAFNINYGNHNAAGDARCLGVAVKTAVKMYKENPEFNFASLLEEQD